VLPPAAVLLIMTLGYFTVLKVVVFHDWIVFATVWSFFLAGYVIYDIMHYALHHIDTSKHKGSWFHSLQKYHNKHHFSGQYAGFGVSSPLWDLIFRTGYKETR
jgi:sterol desaturase/sphingolipid hydroxylase (fatty acid hydroxylase superfamily)